MAKRAARAKPAAPLDPIPFQRVHFPTASDAVVRGEGGAIEANAGWLIENPSAVVVLEGHCDERGGDEYNLELGERRARSVKAGLIARGVGPDRAMMIVSHGERRPLDTRHTREAWRENRRVEFVVR